MAVIVVGGGPAGLAVGGALKGSGIASTILERGENVGSSWRGHYERLHLHTVRRLSALPGQPIPAEMGRWVAREDLVRYLEDYAARFGLEIRFGTEVTRVEATDPNHLPPGSDSRWAVRTSKGDREAASVVLATGYNRIPLLPEWPGARSYRCQLLHSAQYRNAAPYRDKSVLVVGSGNSGAEIAVDLIEGGAREVLISIRTPPNIQKREFLGIPTQVVGILAQRLPVHVADSISLTLQKVAVGNLKPFGLDPPTRGAMSRIQEDAQIPLIDVGFLKALRARRLKVVAAVESFAEDQVVLADGSRLDVDAVIAATGYRRGLEPLVGHLGVLAQANGLPEVAGGANSSKAPGLYFVGYQNSPGGLLRQIRIEAEAVARALR
jgi:putative flavoprotein involved in K+ transport